MADPSNPTFDCPTCGKRYKLRTDLAGKKVQCKCGEKIVAPKLGAKSHVATIAASSTGPTSPVAPRSKANAEPTRPAREDSPMGNLFEGGDEESDEPVAPIVRSGPQGQAKAPADPGHTSAHEDDDGDTWKWWYYVVAGILIACFSVYQLIEGEPIIQLGGRRNGPLGGFLIAALAIAVGIWSRPARK